VSAPEHFTAKQPTKRIAADCLFTDHAGRLLILEPPYKSTWDLPGGIVEKDESPRQAAQREIQEEIGLTVAPGALLAVDWIPHTGDFTEIIALLFDGGVLTPTDVAHIVTQPSEASSFRFVTLTEAEGLLDGEQFARVTAALKAKTSKQTTYLENGLTP
jgi:ADP-ribose pyrophosphatase YjhB (NUDIX family)